MLTKRIVEYLESKTHYIGDFKFFNSLVELEVPGIAPLLGKSHSPAATKLFLIKEFKSYLQTLKKLERPQHWRLAS